MGLVQLWPLALVAAGVDLLLGGRYRPLVVFGAVFAAAVYAGVGALPRAAARTETVVQGLEGAQRAEVRLEVGVSDLRLDASGDGATLIEGTVQTARGERLVRGFREAGGTAFLELRSAPSGPFGGTTGRRTWDLSLSPSVPLAPTVKTGVGRAALELSGAQLTRLEVRAGVGDTTLTLPRAGRYEATLGAGVGAATVRVPETVTVRLEVSGGVGGVVVRGDYRRDGDLYLSPGYDTAANRVDLRVNGGVGAIAVQPTD